MIHPVLVNPVISPLVGALAVPGLPASSASTAPQTASRPLSAPPHGTGTPTITADGVAAGNGPDMGSVNRASRKVCVVRFKAMKASTGITGDEQVFGPLYLRNGNLVGKLDGQEGVKAHTRAVGAEIAAVVDMTPTGVAVQLVGGLE